jgi:hypothetical protein
MRLLQVRLKENYIDIIHNDVNKYSLHKHSQNIGHHIYFKNGI